MLLIYPVAFSFFLVGQLQVREGMELHSPTGVGRRVKADLRAIKSASTFRRGAQNVDEVLC